MFKKLVSNLPFSPGLLNNIVFYSERLRKENVARTAGVVTLLVALVIQGVFWTLPPTSSVQAAENDIVWGGIGTNFTSAKARMVQIYRDNNDGRKQDFKELFAMKEFGVTEQDLLSAESKQVDTQNKALFSLGRSQTLKPGEIALKSPSGRSYYLKPIGVWAWSKRYQDALYIRSKDIYILWDCGNLVITENKPPKLTIDKTTPGGYPANGSKVRRGQELAWRLTVSNIGSGPANTPIIEDGIPTYTTGSFRGGYAIAGASGGITGGSDTTYYFWKMTSLAAGGNGYTDMRVKVKADAPNGAQICNIATIRADNHSKVQSDQICFTVEVPTTPEQPTPEQPVPEQPTPEQPTPEQPPEFSKRAQNLSAPEGDPRRTDANGTQANAGDEIRYVLSVTNNGSSKIDNYRLESPEFVGDILDYSDIINLGNAEFDTTNKTLNWKPFDIKKGETVELSFTVKVKDPIPTTSTSSSDPSRFDLIMFNIFGNSVEIKLPAPPGKQVERVSSKLPSTGPGATVAISLGLVGVATFLRSRNNLLIKELGLVRKRETEG